MSLGDHITAMSDRLERDTARAGMRDSDTRRLCRVFELVAQTRASRIGSREHHNVLHTARTVLILLGDAGVTAPDVLISAAALDPREPDLMPDPDELPLEPSERELIDQATAAVLSETAIEELLAAGDRVRLLALAEALDRARHLHLQPPDEWPAFHSLACSVFLPIASRTHDTLARRFAWWCNMFQNRYLHH